MEDKAATKATTEVFLALYNVKTSQSNFLESQNSTVTAEHFIMGSDEEEKQFS